MGNPKEWPPGTLPFEAAYRARRRLEEAKRGEAIRGLIANLRSKAEISNKLLTTTEHLAAGNPSRLGSSTPGATVVVFSDYQCGFCRKADSALRPALQRWPALQVVVRHYPLPNHPQAVLAAKAALCADDQGKFESYHRLAFHQTLSPETLDEAARAVGLDVALFRSCLESPHVQARLETDLELGKRLKVDGTPTIYFNNERMASVEEVITRLENRFSSSRN
ncbi:MAG: DsbA family protein [Acidobacteriota bacterium]|jgi:protein-disulfide isomerase